MVGNMNVYLVLRDISDFDPAEEVVHVSSTRELAEGWITGKVFVGPWGQKDLSIKEWVVDE